MTDLDPSAMRTPKTDARVKRGTSDLPAVWVAAGDGTDLVSRIRTADPLAYEPAYRVGEGWGRIAVELEVEAIDARSRRRWSVEAAAVHAIFALPGYVELADPDEGGDWFDRPPVQPLAEDQPIPGLEAA